MVHLTLRPSDDDPNLLVISHHEDFYHPDELAALMGSVQRVGNVIEKAYGADALTVACQVRSHLFATAKHLH